MKRTPDAPTVHKDPDNPTRLGGPVVAPGVTDPAALRYAAQIAARKGPPKYTTPVAGGASPPIPRLDLPSTDGLSMADQANMQRMAAAGPPPGSMFQAGVPPSASAGPSPRPPAVAGLLPIDILPEAAKADPDFRSGQGSMYATAQPALAMKYGVIRNGQHVPPQAIGQKRAGLSNDTLRDLQTLQTLQKPEDPKVVRPSDDVRFEAEAASGIAGAAGRLGNAPSEGPKTAPKMDQAQVVEAMKKLDDFDFNTFREMMMKDIINNEGQREIIEKRCKPLNIDELVMSGFVTQRVPIIPNRFEPEFRSMTGTEDLAIKRLVMLESKGLEVSERYLLDKFSLMGVTIGLYSLNGNVLPTHQDAKGDFDEEKFWTKFNLVTKYPFHMLSSIGVNYFWFDIRVRKLFVADSLGNG